MPRIQYRAEPFRCGWDAKSAADRIIAGPSSLAMEVPVASDKATIPAVASCGTDPVIAMMKERKRAVAGTWNLLVIRPPGRINTREWKRNRASLTPFSERW